MIKMTKVLMLCYDEGSSLFFIFLGGLWESGRGKVVVLFWWS